MKQILTALAFLPLMASAGTLGEGLDCTSLSWTTGGDAAWGVQNSVSYDGVDAARSGSISHGQSTWMETTVDGPVTVAFQWKVSSESGYDYLRFSVDDEDRFSISGEQGWESRSVSVGTGSHTLKWQYSKDGSVSNGDDCGWVDQLVVTPAAPVTAEMTTYYVDATTGNDGNSGLSRVSAKGTIQAAVNVARNGDIIRVASGSYSPITSDNKYLSIISDAGAEATIIDGRGVARCADFTSADSASFPTNTIIVGFTLKDGVVRSEPSFGGGIFGGIARRCIISGGYARGGGGAAAAILENCLIYNNSARNGGGCDCCVIRNCTMVNNRANDHGAAYSTCVVENSIVYGNTGLTEEFNGTSLGWGNALTQNIHRENVFAGDPGFVDAENGDFRLAAGSPCIDAGDNEYVAGVTDLAGNTRIANGTVDIGCYEYGAVSPLTDGLVAWYKFDGNANDSSGNGYVLTTPTNNDRGIVRTAPQSTNGRHGERDGAYYFSGDSELEYEINAEPHDDDFVLKETFSYSLWFKTSVTMSSYGSALTSWNPGNDIIFGEQGDCHDGAGVGLRVGTDGMAVVEHAGMYRSTTFRHKCTIGDGWHHAVVVVENNGAPKVYLDGSFVGEGIENGRTKLFFCAVGGGTWGFYTGSIDDFMVYNRALSAAEVMTLYEEGGVTPPSPMTHTVTFDLGAHGRRTGGGVLSQTVEEGAAAVAPSVAVNTGYRFTGWNRAFDYVTGDVTVTAQYEAIRYSITYANTMGAANGNRASYTIKDAFTFAALPDIDGWKFLGWSFSGVSRGTTGNLTVSANWEKTRPEIIPDDDDPMDAGIANTYDGIVVDADGLPLGYLNLKAAKVSRAGVVKVTATIQMRGEARKVTVKANVDVSDAELVASAPDGRVLDLLFTRNTISGTFDGYEVQGMRNLLASAAKNDRDRTSKAKADAVLRKIQGNYTMAFLDDSDCWNGLAVSVAAKGKVKVSGRLADGTSVSTATQLIVGDETSCVPVIYTKKDTVLAFNIYFDNESGEMSVFGYADALISPVSQLRSGLSFNVYESIYDLFGDYYLLEEFLPYGVSVEPSGTKWVVADGARAGMIKLVDGEAMDTKESENPSGLKLTYAARNGTFKGSFKIYALDANDKLKSFQATVSGVVVDGYGFGSVTVKKFGSAGATIE